MDTGSFLGLLNNAILLLALSVIYEGVGLNELANRRLREVLSGVLVGVIGIAVMLTPWELSPGIFFDTRWVLTSICGLFFGWLPTLIAGVILVLFRLLQGGDGAVFGSLVIIATSLVGLGWRYLIQHRNWPIGWIQLYLFGITIQFVTLACMMFMPDNIRWTIIQTVGPPMLLVFPVVTLLLGLALRRQDLLRLAHDEIRFKNTVLSTQQEASEDGILAVDNEGKILSCNGRMKRLWDVPESVLQTGLETELIGHQLEQVLTSREFASWLNRMQRYPYEQACECVSLKSGQVIECYTSPLLSDSGDHYGRLWSYRDITRREQMEADLIRERNQAESILEGTNAGTWHWNIEQGSMEVDERFAAVAGFEQQELMPLAVEVWRKRLHPEDDPDVDLQLIDHIKGKKSYYDHEFRLLHKLGHWVWVNARGKVSNSDASGKATSMSGILIDISARKAMEDDLRKSEELFRNSFKVTPIPASLTRVKDGQYFEVNQAYVDTFGWSEAHLLSAKTTIKGVWLKQSDREDWLSALHEHGSVADYPVRLTNSKGEHLDIQMSACLIDYAGEPCVLTMLYDVTGWKQAEAEIREREYRYRTLFDSAEVSIWNEDFTGVLNTLQLLRDNGVTDLRAHLKENSEAIRDIAALIKVVHVNQATLELFGITSELEFFNSVGDLFGDEAEEVFVNELCAIWEGHSYFRSEAKLKRLDGKEITGLISMPISSSEDDMRNVPVSILDITDRVIAEQALAASQSLYRTILDSMDEVGEGLMIVGADSRIEYMNHTMVNWFGDQMGERGEASIASLDRESGYSAVPAHAGTRRIMQYHPGDADGRHFEVVSAPIQNRNGSVSRLEIIRDITNRKQQEVQIRKLSQAVEQSPVSVVITDTEGNIEYVNSAFERISGYKSQEVIGQHTRLLQSGSTPQAQYEDLWQTVLAGKTWQGELQNKKKSGELFWERAFIAPVLDNTGVISNFLAVKEDITLQKEQEERILRQAHFDSLTELPNRFLSLDRLSQLIKDAARSAHHVAVLFLDLDDFKKVNDTMGHETGDQLLKLAASRLRAILRDHDTVGRLGGDEFIILLGGLSEVNDSRQAAEQVLEQFRRPFSLQGRELVLTVSLGIALYPEDGSNPAELLRNADTAMYHSKAEGRNTYHYFTDSMNQGVARRLIIEEQLRGALVRGELSVLYQPLIEIASRRMIGAEALLRWCNPLLGNVSPAEFIPIAEQTGMILPIGEYVIEEALAQLALWQQTDLSLKVAVNISPRQFRDPQLVSFIEQTLERSGITASSLELEITEGVLMSGLRHIDRALATLNELGVEIAMDDFGTGYSSLSYLRSYPFDILKIDQSFIRDITVDDADRALVSAAIAMAHGLGLKVVAEGVETEAQLAYLVSQRCDFAQGYLFSRPVESESIRQLLLLEEAY
ncbi:MAG: EAL domain-containing protein [Sedimenticola thiotaurini]|uniref:EAL domain-containing protein n=1 Tax=Sedimenticola thiotaurini TaxID=1543721 RepID=A0A558D0P8_9GAMM|nr:MAG: EAL domain-containing protein [Sedimenticola thiotaurini]